MTPIFQVYADLSSDPYLDTPKFNCTDTCPEAYPNVVHSQEGAYCSDDPMAVAKKGVEGPITAIVVAIVCCVLITGVFGVVCFCQVRIDCSKRVSDKLNMEWLKCADSNKSVIISVKKPCNFFCAFQPKHRIF